jgi:hypothetical protein
VKEPQPSAPGKEGREGRADTCVAVLSGTDVEGIEDSSVSGVSATRKKVAARTGIKMMGTIIRIDETPLP